MKIEDGYRAYQHLRELQAKACTHHWTVTSPCPYCLTGQLDELRAENERLRARVRELEHMLKQITDMLDWHGGFPRTVADTRAALAPQEKPDD